MRLRPVFVVLRGEVFPKDFPQAADASKKVVPGIVLLMTGGTLSDGYSR